jgi:hypothetical protein
MRGSGEILGDLFMAADLELAVRALSDADLREVRGALARGDFQKWNLQRVHGMCILEGCRRFENPDCCDKCHGTEVAE